jgi:hypothetical protein
VDRSCVSVAAISWMIACGLLFGGAGALGIAQAGADPGTVGNSQEGQEAGGGADSNVPGGGRNGRKPGTDPGSPHGDSYGEQTNGSPSGGGPLGGTGPGGQRPSNSAENGDHHSGGGPQNPTEPGGETSGDGEETKDPGWPWPPSDGEHGNGGGLGGPAQPGVTRVQAPESGGGGNGGGIAVTNPSPTVPGQPGEPTPVQFSGGAHESLTAGEPPTIVMPPVIGLPPAIEAPVRPVGNPGGNGSAAETGAGGRPAPAKEPTAVRERPPASVGNATEGPASFRVGYPEYLREAKTGEVAALAVPGVVGLLALTALGGVVGYRQARAGHLVRATGTARFLQ